MPRGWFSRMPSRAAAPWRGRFPVLRGEVPVGNGVGAAAATAIGATPVFETPLDATARGRPGHALTGRLLRLSTGQGGKPGRGRGSAPRARLAADAGGATPR